MAMSIVKSSELYKKWVKEVSHFLGFETNEVVDEATTRLLDREIERTTKHLSELVRLHKTPEDFRKLVDLLRYADDLLKKVKTENSRLAAGDLTWLSADARRQYATWVASLTPKKGCRHMKGGDMSRFGWDKFGGPRGIGHKDYSVARHTFTDGRQKIWCLQGCGFVSWSGDEKWGQALTMADNSTNSPSSSERHVSMKKGAPNVGA